MFLAFVQSIGITAGFNTLSSVALVKTPNVQTYLLIGAILTTGSMVVTWLGEQITDKGFGNGVSMIIFAGIISSIPSAITTIYEDFFVNVRSSAITNSYIFVGILIVAVLAIVFFTTFIQQAEYKIPIQYTKLVQGAPTSSYLPLKVNPAGVIPVIFASSITTIPSTIIPFFQNGKEIPWLTKLQELLNYQTPVGMIIYAILIILFSFFYTFVQVNPEKTAENLQKKKFVLHSKYSTRTRNRRIYVIAIEKISNNWFSISSIYFLVTNYCSTSVAFVIKYCVRWDKLTHFDCNRY